MTAASLLEIISDCLRAAADEARRRAGDLAVAVKSADRNQVVTDADVAIGRMTVDRIRRHCPEDTVVEEESGVLSGTSARTWVVDPIDGTSNYATGSPLYGSMIAVLDEGRVTAAGVVLPAFDETYLAVAGGGVLRNGVALPPARPRPMAEHLLAYGMDIDDGDAMAVDWRLLRNLVPGVLGVRMSNSVYDAVQVARGVYGAYVHRGLQLWDVAPIELLIVEAGGACATLDGRPLRYPVGHPGEVGTLTYAAVLSAPGTSPDFAATVEKALAV